MERHAHHTLDPKAEDELWVTPEESMFGTRLPRPSHVAVHIAFAFFMFLAALLIAIFMQHLD